MSEEMTKEQARDTLRNAAWLGTNEDRERIERAVELLCGEPCEDTISRKASIAALKKHFSDDDSIDTECGAYWHHGNVIDVLQGMQPVTPKQRTGHWIETAEEYYKAVNEYGGGVNEDTPYFVDDIACSECLSMFSVIDNETERFDCCPHCGAKMVEPQETDGAKMSENPTGSESEE